MKTYVHLWYLPQLFFSENHAVYETWKYMVEPERPQMTIGCMHFVCWITMATHTHTHTQNI
jgi:hypothetical protein